MIKNYANRAAHDAATRSTTESEASLLLDTRECLIDGVNVKISLAPKVGDIVCHDASNKVHFIAFGTYHALPSGWATIGVVVARFGKKIMIAYKSQASKKFADVYQWVISGFNLDGAEHTSAVTLHSAAVGDFTYQASSKAQFQAQLRTWLSTHQPSGYTYSTYVDAAGDVILQLDTYSAALGTDTMSGLTLTAHTAHELPAISSVPRVNGNSTYFAGMCRKKFEEYYAVSGTTPTAQVPLTSTDVVKRADFKENQYCDLLRAKYCVDPTNPTDADYAAYIDANMARWPYTRGVLAEEYRDGKDATYKLANVKYEDNQGNLQIKYPAAAYAASIGFSGVKGLEVGDWFMPSPHEAMEYMPRITYGTSGITDANCDDINKSLAAIGGSRISAGSSAWLAARSSGAGAWYYNGSYGFISVDRFYYSYTVVPVALYSLSD